VCISSILCVLWISLGPNIRFGTGPPKFPGRPWLYPYFCLQEKSYQHLKHNIERSAEICTRSKKSRQKTLHRNNILQTPKYNNNRHILQRMIQSCNTVSILLLEENNTTSSRGKTENEAKHRY